MHHIQQQLLELSQKYDLRKMGLRQIGRLIGVDHPQKVKFHLEKIGLLDDGKKTRASFMKSPMLSKTRTRNMLSIPILGLANCGDATMLAEEHIEGILPVSRKLIPTDNVDNLFAVKAVGVSMNRADINGKTIEDGDYVIVDGEDKNAKTGDYVLSVISGLANIKRFTEDKIHRQVILQSESSSFFPPIHIHEDDLDEYLVNGKVIEVIKQMQEESVYRYEPVGKVI
ncbi:MAG: S24 family peptidase [bacterium]|nr:S24 family peptidase [bacterium]